MSASFPDGVYVDVPGLCAVATLEEIEKQGWSLNPGRYVGVAAAEDDGVDFRVRLEELNEELEKLNVEAASCRSGSRRTSRSCWVELRSAQDVDLADRLVADICARFRAAATPSASAPSTSQMPDGHSWVQSQELIDRESGPASTSGLRPGQLVARYWPAGTASCRQCDGANVGQLASTDAGDLSLTAICGLSDDPSKSSTAILLSLRPRPGRALRLVDRLPGRRSRTSIRTPTNVPDPAPAAPNPAQDRRHPLRVRRSDREQQPPDQAPGGDGPADLPRVVRRLPLSGARGRTAGGFGVGPDSGGWAWRRWRRSVHAIGHGSAGRTQ